MAPASGRSAATARRPAAAGREARSDTGRRHPLGVVAERARRQRHPGRRTAVLALVVAVAAPLAVAASYAELTAGQVRLTRLQQQLSVEQQQQSALQLRVAQLENPATIAGEAKRQGMVPAGSVTAIPEVPTGPSEAGAIHLPAAPPAGSTGSAGSTGARGSAGSTVQKGTPGTSSAGTARTGSAATGAGSAAGGRRSGSTSVPAHRRVRGASS